MRKFSLTVIILLLGALALSPVIAALGLDPVPGDIAVPDGRYAGQHPGDLFAVRKRGSGPFILLPEAIRAAAQPRFRESRP